MTLLDAVNFILPRINEHQVTSLAARSPTLQLLVQSIEDFKNQILLKGWWFNEQLDYLGSPDVDGRIGVGTALTVSSVDRTDIAVVGGYLRNMTDYTDVFTAPVRLNITHAVEYDNLPLAMQNWIKYAVLIDQSNTDVGASNDMAEWERQRRSAEQSVLSEHLRNRKYNTKNRLAFHRFRRARGGV